MIVLLCLELRTVKKFRTRILLIFKNNILTKIKYKFIGL